MFTVYKTTNLIDGSYYLGIHKTDDPNDEYLGSGNVISRAIDKYGVSNFKKEVLFTYVREYHAYRKEYELVREAKSDPLCYNIADGGKGGWLGVSKEILSRNGKNNMEKLQADPTPALIAARKRNGIRNIVNANANPTPKMVLYRETMNANPTPAMIEARKTRNDNPTPAMIAARRSLNANPDTVKARIEGVRRVNANPTLRMLEVRTHPTLAMIEVRSRKVVCDKCGLVCANVGALGNHKRCAHRRAP